MLALGAGLNALSRPLRLDVLRRRMETAVMRDDKFPCGHRQIDAHMEAIAPLVMPLGEFDKHATSHDSRVIAWKLRDPLADVCFEGIGMPDASKGDGGCHTDTASN